ncbi:uncharacterized protein EKO05_0009285 [Ascochyta rabiei]|uniref:uncharacterized protein n=1 Tax=Didymella rabiei TaxID=5454 RepID=UPI0019026CCC|nr:uncharacterized protein EKO05_0009285 [Ascochyta rabiei]UPX19008.1 hypothetical protein EKO05_0009285 [Ascochyta rabiei]
MVPFQESGDVHDVFHELTSCLDTKTLLDLARRFSETYENLARDSTEHFLVTPVTALPTGKEQGRFLAIDLGGSNLRVGFVELAGDLDKPGRSGNQAHHGRGHFPAKINRSHDKSWSIGDHLKMDKPEDLFKWVGDCMAEVVADAINDTTISKDKEVLLGVTFSFPMAQTSLSEARLLPMGKGFAINTHLNLGEMLLAGYARHCSVSSTDGILADDATDAKSDDLLPSLRVAAITNDTVATFVSLAYTVNSTRSSRVTMGLIVGTGTNATIPMRPTSLHPSKLSGIQQSEAPDSIVINTEWTIRGTDKPLEALGIKTRWDRTLDQNSDAPGFQPFEYMTSGRYLGEIVRMAFVYIVSLDTDMDRIPYILQDKNALPTRFLSETVARLDHNSLRELLAKEYPSNVAGDDSFWTATRVHLLRSLAQTVQQRSSALIAAASVGLLGCAGDISLTQRSTTQPSLSGSESDVPPDMEELVIAYTGSTISQYPHWLEDCQKWIDELVTASGLNSGRRVVLREAVDGGIVGAAVLAGMENKMLQ